MKRNRKSSFFYPLKKKVGPLHLLPPLWITSGSELTWFYYPFTNRFSTLYNIYLHSPCNLLRACCFILTPWSLAFSQDTWYTIRERLLARRQWGHRGPLAFPWNFHEISMFYGWISLFPIQKHPKNTCLFWEVFQSTHVGLGCRHDTNPRSWESTTFLHSLWPLGLELTFFGCLVPRLQCI